MTDPLLIGKPADIFSAAICIEGATVRISAPSMTVLAALLARLGTTTPAPSPAVTADEKAAVLGNVQQPAAGSSAPPPAAPAAKTTATPAARSDAAAAPGKSNSAAPADKPSSAGTQDGASESVNYDDVKKVVNTLYAIDPDHAFKLLAEFKVQNGKQLDTTQWIAFVEQGRAKLKLLKEGAPA